MNGFFRSALVAAESSPAVERQRGFAEPKKSISGGEESVGSFSTCQRARSIDRVGYAERYEGGAGFYPMTTGER